MLYLAAFLFTASIYSSVRPLVAQTKFSAECTFGDDQEQAWKSGGNMSASPRSLTFSGQLPSTRNLIHSCLVKTDSPNRIMYLIAKRNKESKGSLHVSVYAADETCHLDISESAVSWSSMPICPSTNERYLTFSGTTDLSFTVEMAQDENIQLNQARNYPVDASNSVLVTFTPKEDISDTQLDVTVTSESDVPAYLKVSRVCKDVTKDNIDDVDYKGESLRLSFAKKGRITLSKVSIPPLTDSTTSWFIGIAIKNATGDTPFDAEKTVTLTLTRSFDYSYIYPIGISQGAICFLLGLVVSLWAWFIFRECICRCPTTCTCPTICTKARENEPLLAKKEEAVKKEQALTRSEFFSAMKDVILTYSFARGPKTYSYITAIVGSVLMVGAFQFVFADWYLMIHEGDRDHCYYNDFCYRVGCADIPFNLIISNLAYVIHGLILAANVLCMESEVLARCRKLAKTVKQEIEKEGRSEVKNRSTEHESYEELPCHVLTCPDISLHFEKMLVPKDNTEGDEIFAEARKKKFSFSMGYAFAWALCFEGMFSALYHLCPSKLTFQFDTAFMFVIAGLSVVLLYNGIEMQECSAKVEAKRRVGAANFFLFFLVPLFIFNYFGTMYHSEAGLATFIKVLFLFFLIVWYFAMACWAGKKLKLCSKNWNNTNNNVVCHCKCCECCKDCDECCTRKVVLIISCVFGLGGIPVFLVVLWSVKIIEFPDVFLFFCVTENIVAALGSFLMGCNCQSSCKGGEQNESHVGNLNTKNNSTIKDCCFCFIKFLFSFALVILLGFALYCFHFRETTNKALSPEKSRDLNQECVFLDFLDYHDIWHILSSFVLLMGALMVIHVSYESPQLIKIETPNKGGRNKGGPGDRELDSCASHDSPETAGSTSDSLATTTMV